MSAQDRALLERQIARLEGSVADLTAQLREKGVAYIKKDSMFSMSVRYVMSQSREIFVSNLCENRGSWQHSYAECNKSI